MTVRDRLAESNTDRRLVALLVVLLLVLLGSGIGTFVFDSPAPDDGNETTPTPTQSPTPVTDGPSMGTETPTPDDRGTGTPSTPDDTPDTPAETRTTDRDDDDDDDDDERSTTPSPGLALGDDGPLFSAQAVAPGQSDRSNLTVRNAAGEDARLTISTIDVTDEENGITDAERSVDTPDDGGELSEHLEVRFAITDGGNEEYLVGSDSEYVPLDDVSSRLPSSEYPLGSGEEVTLVADWRLPRDTGNEVQSDGVTVDLGLRLESTNA